MKREMFMRVAMLALFLLLAGLANLALAPAVRADDASLRVVSPPNGVWVMKNKLFLAGVTTDTGKVVKISGVDVANKGPVPVKEGGVFGATITLDKGQNTIKLTSGKSSAQVQVFYTTEPDKTPPPKGFKRLFVHKDQTAMDCQVCHRFHNGKFDFKRVLPVRANCTNNCHKDKGKAKHVHGPVGSGVCIACHSPHGTSNPSFVERTGTDLCTVCHQARKSEFTQKYIHPPLEDGCTDCHDPHQSNMRYQLKANGDSVSALCFQCHEQDMFTKKFQHEPVAEGDCVACHSPHSSPNPKLLIATPEEGALCFQCHEDRKEEFNMKDVHPPAAENCTECHNPHSSDYQYMLKAKGGNLCASCHKDVTPEIYQTIDSATVKHPPVAKGECVKCHRPHSSNYVPLLKKPMEKLCFSCHTDMGDYINSCKDRHGPVQTGDCTACHNVHGSKFAKLLVRNFPLNFYSDYSPDKYDLCFGCHNKDIAQDKYTTTLTNFRDGNYNLHYFHVHREKGRTCTACHDPHASNQAKHIRQEVPFGQWWSYPITYTKTATGGTCVVGCHSPKTYDRVHPRLKQ